MIWVFVLLALKPNRKTKFWKILKLFKLGFMPTNEKLKFQSKRFTIEGPTLPVFILGLIIVLTPLVIMIVYVLRH